MERDIMNLHFNVENGSYQDFITKLSTALALHSHSVSDIENYHQHQLTGLIEPHPLLPEQVPEKPKRWMHITLTADAENSTTLAVRGDNVYLVGFKNKENRWYEFGKETAPTKNSQYDVTHLLPNSTYLGFSGSYGDLGCERWDGKMLGKTSAKQAVFELYKYNGEGKRKKKFREYLAKLVVMICEAARMFPYRGTVGNGWGLGSEMSLPDRQVEYLTNWQSMSRAMMGWAEYTTGLTRIGITCHDDARQVVHLILNSPIPDNGNQPAGGDDPGNEHPEDGNDHSSRHGDGDGNGHSSLPGRSDGQSSHQGDGNCQSSRGGGGDGQSSQPTDGNEKCNLQQHVGHGHRLVEVFTLDNTADVPFLGSITVFDGRLGQIIFWDEGGGDADSKRNFVLTGPYRGISADGRVALKIIEKEKGKEGGGGVLIWDPYNKDEHQYDKILTKDITEDLKLTYAVLSSAVEASVQVDVFLFETITVYGEITVQSGENPTVVLLSSGVEGKVELAALSAGSRIPLTRSVVVWPVGSSIDINVNWFHPITTPTDEGTSSSASATTTLNFSFEDHTPRVCFKTLDGIGYVRVSVDDTREYRDEPNNSLPRSLTNQITQENREMSVETGSLVVHPSQLTFTFHPNKIMSCLLHLTNKSYDDYIAFQSLPGHEIQKLSGILPPDSTSTYLVQLQSPLPPNTDVFRFILESCVVPEEEENEEEDVDKILDNMRTNGGIEATPLQAIVCGPADETTKTSEPIQPGIETIPDAVHSSIVEITVQVQVFLFGCTPITAGVLGDITVQNNFFEEATVVLFPSERLSGKVPKLFPSSDGSTIPLSPYVFEWQVGSLLVVNVGTLKFSFEDHTSRVCFKTLDGIGHVRVSVVDTREYRNELNNSLPRSLTNQAIQMDQAMSDGTKLLVVHPSQLTFTFQQNQLMHCLLHLTNDSDDQIVAFRCGLGMGSERFFNKIGELAGTLPPDSTSTYIVTLERHHKRPFDMDALFLNLESWVVPEVIKQVTVLMATVCRPADEATTSKIIPSAGQGSHHSIDMRQEEPLELELNYAVLSSPVKAIVQVNLFLFGNTPGTANIYGEISAHSQLASGEEVSVVLFSIEDKVEFIPSSAGSTIPLTRSVVPWPVKWLEIQVRLDARKETITADEDIKCHEFAFADNTDKVQFATLEGIGYIQVSVDDTGEYREEPNNSLPSSLMMNQMNPDMSIETDFLAVHPSQLTFTFQQNKHIPCLLHLTNKSADQHVAFRFSPDQKSASYYHRIWETSGILSPHSTSTYIVGLESQQQLPSNMEALSLILQSCITLEDEEDVDKIFVMQTNDGIIEVTLKATVCGPADERTTTSEIIPSAGQGSHHSIDVRQEEPSMAKELTYAVVRSAVEATVQVDLFLIEEIGLYGKIMAHSQLPSGEEVSMLFSCEFKDRVHVQPSSTGWNVPLTRSVVAWPLGSPLLIKVSCFPSFIVRLDGLHLETKGNHFSFCSTTNTSIIHKATSASTTTTPVFEGLEFSFDDNTDKVRFATLEGVGYIRVSVDDTGKYREKRNNSLPRLLMNQIETDIPGALPPLKKKEIETDVCKETKLLVIRASYLTPCLLHLTNKSDDQHVAFRCGMIRARWELDGILPPDSTSTYLLETDMYRWQEMDAFFLTLQSSAASKDRKHVGNIFRNPAKNEIEEVTLSCPAGIFDSQRIRLWTGLFYGLFDRPGKGIKEVALKATVIDPTDMSMASETQIKAPTTEPSIDQSDLLDVYPLQLHFPFKLNKRMCCPLQLTNRTDDYVIFKFLPYTSLQSELRGLAYHLYGILPPRSTCTYVVATKAQKCVPHSMDAFSVILKSFAAEKMSGADKYISNQDPMHGAIPKAICDTQPILPKIEILTESPYRIWSMDVHPTEPWILASLDRGRVSIWNYKTQAKERELIVSDDNIISSAIFIAREKWFLAADGKGSIHVVTYTTMGAVKRFQGHKGWVNSLAVHPNQTFVLSASTDRLIKLWNWDVNPDAEWECVRTYGGHSGIVTNAMFNPYDSGNTFASASEDCKVKIWSTNDQTNSPKPIAILDCGADKQMGVAYFSLGGQQYIITGSLEGAARVWDLRTNKCIKELKGTRSYAHSSVVGVVDCALDNINPVLITVSADSISFFDAITYEPRYGKVSFGLGSPRGVASVEVEGKRSFVILFDREIATMEMNNDHVNPPATVEQDQKGVHSA